MATERQKRLMPHLLKCGRECLRYAMWTGDSQFALEAAAAHGINVVAQAAITGQIAATPIRRQGR